MGKLTTLTSSVLITLCLIPNVATAKIVINDGWIANSYGISKNGNCIERAIIGFKKVGLAPRVGEKGSVVYGKNEKIIAQVRCINEIDNKQWWYIMVVGDERIKVRNILDSELNK